MTECRDTGETPEADLRHAIETQHSCRATLAQTVPVHETFQGKPVWDGVVHVFDLEGHPKATRAYAWSSPIEGSDKRRFFAVLELGGIKSPVDAVRAAIVAEHRERQMSGWSPEKAIEMERTHIERGEGMVARQAALVKRLIDGGHDKLAREATAVLGLLHDSLGLSRDRLRDLESRYGKDARN